VEKINLEIQIEDLAGEYPEAVGFLTRHGVRCIRCGEPIWGTLGELLEEEGIADPVVFVEELIVYLKNRKTSKE
jgi:methionine synthase II (cobalamin-independent)